MLYIICLFLGLGVFLVASSVLASISAASQLRQRLPIEVTPTKKPKVGLYFYFIPIFLLSSFLLEKLKFKEALQQKLNAAHTKLTAVQFFSIQLVSMVALPFLASSLVSAKSGALVVAVALGFFLPQIWLKKKILQRKQILSRLLPETIDLLGLCMEAGLDFTTALEWIVKKTRHTPLVEELGFVLEEIKWGKSRAQALKDMAKRYDLSELNSFVQTLVQAERMGTPVVEVLSIISEDTRTQRFHRGEREALKSPIKMLIPLIFCILPVIGIVIGGPILIQFTAGNMFKSF